ncbi:porin [Photobacterium sp. MCCC 1A19761]|uniref:porin n=1 Tax=Photobacterium sp. MCCC 1A19761 TaxID=3115000 RepID=UPI00307FBC67
MKKTLLAVAIPAIIFSNAASAVELLKDEGAMVDFYGQLRTQVEKYEDKDVTLNAGSSRAGVQAQYALSDTVDVFGKVEFGIAFKESKDEYNMKNRLHFAGVDTDFGKISFGRQWIVSDETYGADYSYFFGGSAMPYATLSGARHDSLIKYVFEGENFLLAANYGLAEDDTNQELSELYVTTSVAGFNFHVGGGVNRDKSYKVGTDKVTNPAKEADVNADLENTYYEGTVEYTFGPALIGFTYYNAELESQTSALSIDSDGYSLGGTFSWAENATAYAGYEYLEQTGGGLSDDSQNIYIGTDYHFNKWSRIYVEYGYKDGTTLAYSNTAANTTISGSKADGESQYAIGARVYW